MNKKNPFISIIIPTYNEENFIVKCITSLLNQTYEGKIEIIISDGRSTDKTCEKIKKLRSKNKNIILLDNKERYSAQGRNLAISHAKGEFIAYIDGHSFADKNWLKNLLNSYNSVKMKDRKLAAMGSIHKDAENSKFSQATTLAFNSLIGGASSTYRTTKKIKKVNSAYACLFRRDLFEKIGKYDSRFIKGQDLELNLRITQKFGYSMYINPSAITFYYKRDTIKKLFLQMFNYGYWRYKVMRHLKKYSWVTFVPSCALILALIMIILSIFSKTALFYVGMIFLGYLGVLGLYFLTYSIIQKKMYFDLFPIFICIHFGYGLGFIFSVLFRNKKFIDER